MSTAFDPEPFSVTAKPSGTHIVLEVKGELDMGTAPLLAEELATHDGAAHDLVVDLSKLTFIDSTGIHTLARLCGKNGTRVVCPPGSVRRVFAIVSLDEFFRLHGSLEDALTT
jgi:anti-anti-sigma factor